MTPYLVSFNTDVASIVGLHPDEEKQAGFLRYFTGVDKLSNNGLLPMCYAGHQFGRYAPQLGDGRIVVGVGARPARHFI